MQDDTNPTIDRDARESQPGGDQTGQDANGLFSTGAAAGGQDTGAPLDGAAPADDVAGGGGYGDQGPRGHGRSEETLEEEPGEDDSGEGGAESAIDLPGGIDVGKDDPR
jgi:hypothetical protein